MNKRVSIFGSTGSIGQNVLSIVRHFKNDFRVTALAAKSNTSLLETQAKEFHPEIVAVYDKEKALELQKRIPHVKVVGGMEGLLEMAAYESVDLVVAAMTGSVGILPTARAISCGKTIALANKEVLVSAGDQILKLAKQHNVQLLPIDSEHNAIFQCLQGSHQKEIRRIILTASGGPFSRSSQEELNTITIEKALAHPTWRMGAKVTIDSSTLMNKGLEVIEAHFLFGVAVDKIEVVIHPQSVIHSIVEFIDGSMIAQLSEPNMLFPIQYAMTYPERKEGLLPPFDFSKARSLEFAPPDLKKFPCLDLAYYALSKGGSLPCYLNAANEKLVERFLKGEIHWQEIGSKLEKLLMRHQPERHPTLEALLEVDALARREAG